MSDLREAMWGVVQRVSAPRLRLRRLRRPTLRPARWRTRRARSGSRLRGRAPNRRTVVDRCVTGPQIVIVGAGVGGASIAWHLAERGRTDVLVLERAEPTSGSTFHSAGLVGQLRSSLPLTRMMMHSVDVYRRLEAESADTGRSPGGTRSVRCASRRRRNASRS